ncbi:MAG: NAD(P)-dependent oxidoreductase [Candidatus Hadarchaeales archaeon]
MADFKILVAVSHPGTEFMKKALGARFEVVQKCLGEEELAEEMKKDYDAVVTSHWLPVTREMLESASPQLKAVATLSVGFDHIDLFAEERGIKIVNAAADHLCASAYTVAEFAWALLLSLLRRVGWYSEAVRVGSPSWEELTRGTDRSLWGRELFNRTLCVIGVGRIGSHVCRIGRGFGMKVIGYDPYVSRERAMECGAVLVDDYLAALSEADFISINPCLTDETRGMVNARAIGAMKKGVYIVNTARGAIVDEWAVLEGLRNGKIAGYAADVLWGEPPTEKTSPLLAAYRRGEPNLLISPHVAWVTEEAIQRYGLIVGNKLRELLTGARFPHPPADYLRLHP